MREEEILRQAQEIDTELKQGVYKVKKSRNPLWYILGLLLVFLVLQFTLPQYFVKINPRPGRIPSIEEVMPAGLTVPPIDHAARTREEFRRFIKPSDENVKYVATKIATTACDGNRVCHAKAIFYFVRDNIKYVGDPPDEYVMTFEESMLTGGGDCEDQAVLLANLEEAVGIDAELVFVPGHVLVRVKLPEAPRGYRRDGDWVYIDATCKLCDFGEIPQSHRNQPKNFVEV